MVPLTDIASFNLQVLSALICVIDGKKGIVK